MKTAMLFLLAATSCAFAHAQATPPQNTPLPPNVFFYRSTQGPGGAAVGVSVAGRVGGAPVVGSPYSATIKNETVQTLADGNRIVVSTSGQIDRDSQGRIRQQMELPAIANLAPADAPQIVFIQDPVAQVSYTLNLTDKTAQKMPNAPPPLAGQVSGQAGMPFVPGPGTAVMIAGSAAGGPVVTAGGAGPVPPPMPPPPDKGMVFLQRTIGGAELGQTVSEDLGTQTMEGVTATGTRTTLTIPAGQIGNEQPIKVVTEVWTSPDLKAIVYSKRSDPRMGEQTFQLTNISRNEPNPTLFTVPADFTVVDGPQPIVYSPKQ